MAKKPANIFPIVNKFGNKIPFERLSVLFLSDDLNFIFIIFLFF